MECRGRTSPHVTKMALPCSYGVLGDADSMIVDWLVPNQGFLFGYEIFDVIGSFIFELVEFWFVSTHA